MKYTKIDADKGTKHIYEGTADELKEYFEDGKILVKAGPVHMDLDYGLLTIGDYTIDCSHKEEKELTLDTAELAIFIFKKLKENNTFVCMDAIHEILDLEEEYMRIVGIIED